MAFDPYKLQPPPHLEDELLMIEDAGEMPEVALAESLAYLGTVDDYEKACLQAAAVRAYLKIIRRDLDPSNLGLGNFRGLGKATQNVLRLNGLLRKLEWPRPEPQWKNLSVMLDNYLDRESAALKAGRPYASATPAQVRELSQEIGLDLSRHGDLFELMAKVPALDFIALRTLKRLQAPGASKKRRREQNGRVYFEVLDQNGAPLAGTELLLLGADDLESPEARARAEQVWSLLDLAQPS